MSLKPDSLRPMDIAALRPSLTSREGTEALVIVHAAIEELQATADRLTGPLPEQQRKLSTDDEAGLIELITDLRDLFEHVGGHCGEAAEALWNVTELLATEDTSGSATRHKTAEN